MEGPLKCERWRVQGRTGRASAHIRQPPIAIVGTYLYGRRMYETMVGWETMDTTAEAPFTRNFAHADTVFRNDRSCRADIGHLRTKSDRRCRSARASLRHIKNAVGPER